MKLAKYAIRTPLLIVALLMSLAVSSGTASATSAYDGSYQSTASVRSWWSFSGCDSVDTTFDWSSYVLNGAKWPPNIDWSANRTSLLSALNNGSNGAWGVTQFHAATADFVEIYWTEDASAHLEWSGDGVGVTTTASGDNIHVIDIACSQKFYGVGGATPVGVSHMLVHSYKISTSTTWSSWYTQRSLFVHGFDLNYPSGYEGELVKTDQPSAKYVAMGDSFSSGEGNEPFEAWTDASEVNGCHRSSQAYPRLLQNDLELGPIAFVACSGATTDNVLNGQWNEPPQVDALSADTEVVTITIGGNNVAFADYVLGCMSFCGPGTPVYSAMMSGINAPTFKANLITTYEEILSRASQAEIYVGDYPYLSADDTTTCLGLDFTGARIVQVALNSVIRDAVETVQEDSARIHLVPMNESGSPFEGQHLCNGGAGDFHGLVSPPNIEYSLHPNVDGQEDHAAVFEEAIG
jgi:hypothetical protein